MTTATRARLAFVLSFAGAVLFVWHASATVKGASSALGAGQTARPATPTPQAGASGGRGNADHGRYIVERVAMCFECHSPRDEQGNIIESERYLGGPVPVRPSWGNNWAIRAPRNKGLPGYTDDLAIRLLTQGSIGRDGVQLRPPMPRFYMTPQDASDVIAFLRSVP